MRALLKKVLGESGFNEMEIKDATSVFEPNLSVSEYFSISTNSHIIKSKAFPSYQSLTTAISEEKKKKDAQKKVILPINARYLLSLAKQHHALLDDTIRAKFLTLLKDYMRAPDLPNQDQGSILETIRANCMHTASYFMTSDEDENTGLLPLQELAKFPDADVNARHLSVALLERIVRSCTNSKSNVDLVEQPDAFPLTHNCFLCPSTVFRRSHEIKPEAGKGEEGRKKPDQPIRPAEIELSSDEDENDQESPPIGEPTFINSVMARFNAMRGSPLDSVDDVKRHWKDIHSVGNAAMGNNAVADHSFLLLCRYCENDTQYRNTFSCCVQHLNDHHR